MATRFSADGQDYTRALAAGSQAAYSACCWVKLSADRNTFSTALSLDNGTGSATFLQTIADGTTFGVYEEPLGQLAGTGRALTVGTWYWVGFSISGTTGTFYSRALTETSLTTAALSGLAATHNLATIRIGESAWGTEWLNGAVTAVKVWTAALTQAELEAEIMPYAAMRTANLRANYWLVTPETTDYSGNSQTLSGGSGAVAEAGPDGVPQQLIRGAALTRAAAW